MITAPSANLRARGHGMRYERILQLGSGGMAIVHLALAVGQSGFKRLVVIKEIREEFVANPEMRQLFLAEARLSARLNHPNVVQVSEVVDSDDGVMLVMEYLDGLSLAASYREVGDALTLPMRLRMVCEVLSGLGYAHDLKDYHGAPLGIVHRDVSPQNVFITYDGRVKLLDFGIAKATATPDLTRAGVIKGRVAYMPIEQLRGERVDRRADIYAVGCLLWEAIAGSRMWDSYGEAQIVRRVFEGKIPRLSTRVQVDPELERIVSRATAHEPGERYATTEEMRLALERYTSTLSPVTLREIGALLSTACTEAREQRQELIARAIDRFDRDAQSQDSEDTGSTIRTTSSDFDGPSITIEDRAAETRPRPLMPGETDAIGQTPTTHARIANRARQRSGAGWILAGVLVAAGAIGAALYQRQLVVETPAPKQETSNPVPVDALLQVEVTPSGARVLIDGVAVEGNPPSLRVQSNTEHSVRAEMPGYVPAERRVLVDVDTALTIDLEAIAEPGPRPSAGPAETAAPPRRGARVPAAPPATGQVKPAPTPSAEPKPDNCNPPYFFSGGIKTYKPECI